MNLICFRWCCIQVSLGLVAILLSSCPKSNQEKAVSSESSKTRLHSKVEHQDISQADLVKALVKKNIELLKDPTKRRIAIARLGNLKAQKAIKPITQIVQDDSDDNIIRIAVLALGYIADPRSIPLIISKLQHPNQEIKKAAIQSLSRFSEKGLASIFENLLSSNQTDILHTSLKAIRLSSQESFQAIKSKKLLEQVKLASQMNHKDIVIESMHILTRFTEFDFSQELCGLLDRKSDLEVRIQAARLLGEASKEQAMICLRKILNDQNPQLACVAVAAMIKQGAQIPLSKLAKYLKNPNKEVRITAISELGAIKKEKARQILKNHINSEKDFNVRRHLVRIVSIISRSIPQPASE